MNYHHPQKKRTHGCLGGLFALIGIGATAWLLAQGLLWATLTSANTGATSYPQRSAPQTPALSFEGFNPGNIITDKELHDTSTMEETDIREFIEKWNAGCHSGNDDTPCLSDWKGEAPSFPEDQYCWAFEGGEALDAAQIIHRAAQACELNPQAILVILQKEQGLITASGNNLHPYRYTSAMGYGCPDNGECQSEFSGFPRQIYYAARQFQKYRINPNLYQFHAKDTQPIAYHPHQQCGSSDVYIENQATASLYNYTPHQPNDATLNGHDGACSSWGNLHFYAYWNAWFKQ